MLQMLAMIAAYPYAIGALKKLHVNHSQYGAAPFSIDVGIGAFYKIYLLTMLLGFGAMVVAGIVAAVVTGIAAVAGETFVAIVAFLMVVFFIAAYFGVGSLLLAYTRSRIGNLVFNNTKLDRKVSFASNLKLVPLTKMYFTNFVAILFSFGLAIPWAVIRVTRYRAECLSLQSAIPLDEFIGGVNAQFSATGEELGEFFNIDMSL